MIKVTKPFKYANIAKISNESLNDKQFIKSFKKELTMLRRLPKNVLRAKLLKVNIFSQNGDDFIYNRSTIRAEFEIIKFKR